MSKFHELELHTHDHEDLTAALSAYFSVEQLSGDNQYQCGNCESKQVRARSCCCCCCWKSALIFASFSPFFDILFKDAERQIVLQELPDVLTFNLMRF